MPPKYVLVAGTEKDKEELEKLQAALDEKEIEAKKAMDEHKDELAKLKSAADSFQEPGPVVKAIIAGLPDEDKKLAKARAIKAIDEEKDEEVKAKLQKAMEDIFETGNGSNTNANTEKEKEQTAVIAVLTAKAATPIITKILTAKTLAGASEAEITADKSRLESLSLVAIEEEYTANKVFIDQKLTASQVNNGAEQLIAAEERGFEFNGVSGPLTGKSIDIDNILGDLTL